MIPRQTDYEILESERRKRLEEVQAAYQAMKLMRIVKGTNALESLPDVGRAVGQPRFFLRGNWKGGNNQRQNTLALHFAIYSLLTCPVANPEPKSDPLGARHLTAILQKVQPIRKVKERSDFMCLRPPTIRDCVEQRSLERTAMVYIFHFGLGLYYHD